VERRSDMCARKHLVRITDRKGEKLGIAAALKGAFGTDAEIHMKHGDTGEVFEHARDKISEMSEAAAQLTKSTDGKTPQEKDAIEEAFQAIIRDL
jgi:hypothetical protein